jgi:MFS family permease
VRDRPAPNTPGSPNGPSGPDAEGPGAPPPGGRRRHGVHRNVKLLGVNSLLTDISSESVNAALPLYLRNVLGFSALGFGFFDGIYQGMSAILRIFGGLHADRHRRHKEVAGAGYALSAASKVGLLATTAAAPTAAVLLVDRIGKGIRTAPRDALISLSSQPENMGESFGVHRALDTIGALLGPLLAFALLKYTGRDYNSVFVVSLCVALLGLGVLFFFVRNPPREQLDSARARALTHRAGVRELMANVGFRRLAMVGALLSFMTISDAFIYLTYENRTGMEPTTFPLLFFGTAVAYLALAVPLGRLADRIGRAPVFIGGYVVLIGCYAVLRTSGSGFASAALMLGLLGTYYAATDGVLMAIASTVVPAEARTSGLAWLTTITTAGKLVASIGFGLLVTWQGYNGAVTFFLAGLVVVLPVALLILFRPSTPREVPAA